MADPLSLWLIKELVKAASKPFYKGLKNLVLGEPLARALHKPTKEALEAAIASVLGLRATTEHRKRAYGILRTFWNDDLTVSAGPNTDVTITGALYNIVASGVDKANAPITGLPGYEPTTSLTSLSDELGIRIDADAFAAAFITSWLGAIRTASVTEPELKQLALLLDNEQLQVQIADLRRGFEQQLGETLWAATESIYEHVLGNRGALTMQWRGQWFEMHIAPAHELMVTIDVDYQAGFGEVLEALKSGLGLEETMQRLKVIRRRKICGRSGLDVIAKKLKADKALFGTSLDDPLLTYLEAAQAYKRSDNPLDSNATWYSHYIDEFCSLIEQGKDPLLRSNYPGIFGAGDLQEQLVVPLEKVVDDLLPSRWKNYLGAYLDLQSAALATTVG